MELINLKASTIITIVILLIMCTFVVSYYVATWVKERDYDESNYESLYSSIQAVVNSCPPDKYKKDFIISQFEKLKKMKWKNVEKSMVLYQEFLKRYDGC